MALLACISLIRGECGQLIFLMCFLLCLSKSFHVCVIELNACRLCERASSHCLMMHRVFTGADAGLFLPLPLLCVICPAFGSWLPFMTYLLTPGFSQIPPLSVPRTRPINAPRHVHPNTPVYLKIIRWLVYADGVHIKCSIYSLLPPQSLTLHYRPHVPWGPHRKRKEDRWNCPFYGHVLH